MNLFISQTSSEQRRALVDEIAAVAEQHDLRTTCRRFSTDLGSCVYLADEPGGYRGWLEEIARRVEASLPT